MAEGPNGSWYRYDMLKKHLVLESVPALKGEIDRYKVSERHPDDTATYLGTVALKYFRHIGMSAWEGSVRSVIAETHECDPVPTF